MKEIPIQNIYYLLCYAWDKLEERDLVAVNAQKFKDLPNLFARVLVNGLRFLFKRGLDRSYRSSVEEYRGVKGKFQLTQSLKHNSLTLGRAYCECDELTHNVLQNQLLKATVHQLLRYTSLDSRNYDLLRPLYQRFHDVDDIRITSRDFSKVVLHRNNSFYKFLLNVARVLHENLLFDETKGQWTFRDFVRDEEKMAALFEKFIYNFYRHEVGNRYTVASEYITWQAVPIGDSSLEFLPRMKTDVTLTNVERKLVIDAKYYKEAMVSRYDQEKFRSAHFFQVHAYVSNLLNDANAGRRVEGVLLYPTVTVDFDQTFRVRGQTISFRTIDLRKPWTELESDLLNRIIR
ncbi:5-methylcytosine-specific restriction endonuclease system specificity protein McrC [Dawidia soli]|uniref:5-methylcytosine-specific restriction endonuclease system specificity protein McrC n=1 Tax=Dawidia soli TaxID=2782352 RepID=A0AAP2D9M5_9BACT|nr:5-methylcytosine-specific restriction endonuclease system specificity protein McrC [Dawidia soli]MBT1688003.1 5-methylcytosine-specific restriction endonuclease system specificity protein McrC [Dawidia soli]